MPKGYVIARVTVTDTDAYAAYAQAAALAQERYGAKRLVRGGQYTVLEGEAKARNVVLEFDSYDQALAYYRSVEYQAAKLKREGAAQADIIAVEGAPD